MSEFLSADDWNTEQSRAWAYPEKIEIEIIGESCVIVETETQEVDQWQP